MDSHLVAIGGRHGPKGGLPKKLKIKEKLFPLVAGLYKQRKNLIRGSESDGKEAGGGIPRPVKRYLKCFCYTSKERACLSDRGWGDK